MSKSNNLTDFLVDIADTIRTEKGTTNPINPQDFSTEIGNIADEKHTEGYNEGVNYQKSLLTSLNVTENGTYTNENGYNEVNVNVTGGSKVVLKDGTKLAYSTFTTVSEEYDFSELSTFDNLFYYCKMLETCKIKGTYQKVCTAMFQDCTALVSVSLPNLIPTDCSKMFMGDIKLISIDLFDISLCKSCADMFRGCDKLESIPQFDTSSCENMNNMFYSCDRLTTIPYLETSKVRSMNSMFLGCTLLTSIPLLNTENVTNMYYMFDNCQSLTSIPLLNTAKVENMGGLFGTCRALTTIPQLDTSEVTNMRSMFYGSENLESLPEFNCPKVTNINNYFYYYESKLTIVGGWKNLKCNWNDNYGLYVCPNLTYESCINVLNGLYNFTGNGETPTSSQGNLKVHQNFLDLVGDKISIGTDKGWTITS